MSKKYYSGSERDKKWKKRGDKFWSAFLFTKDGKPKSALMLYSFCLSFVFVAFYILLFAGVINGTQNLFRNIPAFAGNLLQALIVMAAGLALALLLYRVIRDKRMMFCTFAWLILYIIAIAIAMIFYTNHDHEAYALFLEFYFWFVILPIVPTFAFFAVRYYRLWQEEQNELQEKAGEPEWKKYVRH